MVYAEFRNLENHSRHAVAKKGQTSREMLFFLLLGHQRG